jgi:hypothetical protein
MFSRLLFLSTSVTIAPAAIVRLHLSDKTFASQKTRLLSLPIATQKQ